MAYDPIGPRNSKDQRLNDPVHTGIRLTMTNISWHSPLAIDNTPSHGVPSAMPTHQQNSTFSLTKHALTPEPDATSST